MSEVETYIKSYRIDGSVSGGELVGMMGNAPEFRKTCSFRTETMYNYEVNGVERAEVTVSHIPVSRSVVTIASGDNQNLFVARSIMDKLLAKKKKGAMLEEIK